MSMGNETNRDAETRKADKARRELVSERKREELAELLAEDAVRERLAAIPHPTRFRAERGETMLNQVECVAKRSGAAGRARILKWVKSLPEAE